MTRFVSFSLTLVLLACISASGQATSTDKPASANEPDATSNTSLPSEATVKDFLKAWFGWNQELTWKVAEIKPSEAAGFSEATVVMHTPKGSQTIRLSITPDQKYAFSGELMPFGSDPFASIRQQLTLVEGPVEGAKDAAITIVEFGDLECATCKAAQPNITKLMQDEPKARLVFQNYPLESIHKWSRVAAKYLDCLARANNEAAWKFIATVYDHQAELNEQNAATQIPNPPTSNSQPAIPNPNSQPESPKRPPTPTPLPGPFYEPPSQSLPQSPPQSHTVEQMLKGYVKHSGGNPNEVAACAAEPGTEKRVREGMKLAENLHVTSTPTFFINGRRIVGFASNSIPFDVVKEMTDYEIANATGKPAAPAK